MLKWSRNDRALMRIRAENSYSGHLTDAAGSSLFSQMKSIQEQREYLPIYSVRESYYQ